MRRVARSDGIYLLNRLVNADANKAMVRTTTIEALFEVLAQPLQNAHGVLEKLGSCEGLTKDGAAIDSATMNAWVGVGSIRVKALAADSLLSLAFNKRNRDFMKEDPRSVAVLKEVSQPVSQWAQAAAHCTASRPFPSPLLA